MIFLFTNLNRFNEIDDLVALCLLQVAELHNGVVGIAGAALVLASMPHDGFHDIAGTAVVQTFHAAAALGGQSASPQRGGATPTCTDVILHPQTMLNEVGVWPYLLMGIAWHVVVGSEEFIGVLNVVFTSLP